MSERELAAAVPMLVAWMAGDPTRRSRGAIARAVDVSQPAVTAWLSGQSRPTEQYRPALFVLTGIHPDHWKLQSERDQEAKSLTLASTAATGLRATGSDGHGR